jgi:hypothetical protein
MPSYEPIALYLEEGRHIRTSAISVSYEKQIESAWLDRSWTKLDLHRQKVILVGEKIH